MTYGIGDDEAVLRDVERRLQSKYGGRARMAAEQMVRGDHQSEVSPDVAARIKRGPLRSGSAQARHPDDDDPLLSELKRLLGISPW